LAGKRFGPLSKRLPGSTGLSAEARLRVKKHRGFA
jgi:hypothetical protein